MNKSNNWLSGAPDFKNGLMVSREYDPYQDDTTYYEVHTYPELNYIGKFHSSRFDKNVISEHYPPLRDDRPEGFQGSIKISHNPIEGFQVWRNLYPSSTVPFQWLQIVGYGYPSLILKTGNSDFEYEYSIIYSEPEPFEKIVEQIKLRKNII